MCAFAFFSASDSRLSTWPATSWDFRGTASFFPEARASLLRWVTMLWKTSLEAGCRNHSFTLTFGGSQDCPGRHSRVLGVVGVVREGGRGICGALDEEGRPHLDDLRPHRRGLLSESPNLGI
jgi:hypothetical protein